MTPRTIFLALALAACAAVPALAALPPYYQRASEIQAILDSDEVREKLKQMPIDAITSTDADVYQVVGGDCRLEVTVVDVLQEASKPPVVGPRQFTLEVGEADCGGD
jgi:hypothetical protein